LPESAVMSQGRELLQNELAMLGEPDYPHERIAQLLGLERADLLYHALGRAEILPTAAAIAVLEETWRVLSSRDIGSSVTSEEGDVFLITNAGGRPLRLCRNCRPRPDDDIIGFARNDGSITVHKEACGRIPPDPLAHRTLKLAWGSEETREVRLFTVKIDVYDRTGLLFEITDLIQTEGINMPAVHAEVNDGKAVVILDMEVALPRQLVRVLHRIQALVNVYAVICLPPGEHMSTMLASAQAELSLH
jgi:GTP pyrophosphokinase